MSGNFHMEYAEKTLIKKCGDSIYVQGILDLLLGITAIEAEHRERNKPPKKK